MLGFILQHHDLTIGDLHRAGRHGFLQSLRLTEINISQPLLLVNLTARHGTKVLECIAKDFLGNPL